MVRLSRNNLFVNTIKFSVEGKRENKRNKRREVPCVVKYVTVPFHEVRSNNQGMGEWMKIECNFFVMC